MKKILIIAIFLMGCNLYSIDTTIFMNLISVGMSVDTNDFSEKGISMHTILPRISIMADESNIGISFKLGNIYYYPLDNNFEYTFFESMLFWSVLPNSTMILGPYADFCFSPLEENKFEQKLGIKYTVPIPGQKGFSANIIELEAGYSILKEDFYITANIDVFLSGVFAVGSVITLIVNDINTPDVNPIIPEIQTPPPISI